MLLIMSLLRILIRKLPLKSRTLINLLSSLLDLLLGLRTLLLSHLSLLLSLLFLLFSLPCLLFFSHLNLLLSLRALLISLQKPIICSPQKLPPLPLLLSQLRLTASLQATLPPIEPLSHLLLVQFVIDIFTYIYA